MVSLLTRIRGDLRAVADPKKAAKMKSYMKSSMDFYGVAAPMVKNICKKYQEHVDWEDFNEWKNTVTEIWREAKFREERYVAIYLAGHRKAIEHHQPKSLKIFEEMIVTGAWWDFVDPLATHDVGLILRSHPESMRDKMLTWSRSNNMWKRRTSIIAQIKSKEKTDLDLLYRCIEPSINSREFFLRKAIGWALRQVAWRLPDEVIRYVKEHDSMLSPLSKREALKNIQKIRQKSKSLLSQARTQQP